MPRDTRAVGRKLGRGLQGIFGALSSGASAGADPEYSNLLKYGELGNSAVDSSLQPFRKTGLNLFGQSDRAAESLNNQVLMNKILADQQLQNSMQLSQFNNKQEIERAKALADEAERRKKALEVEEGEKSGYAIKAASTVLPEEQQKLFGVDAPLSNDYYNAVIQARFGKQLGNEGVAGIPSYLERAKAEAAGAKFRGFGSGGMFDVINNTAYEPGSYQQKEISYTNEFGIPQTRREPVYFAPKKYGMAGPISQDEIDSLGGNPLGLGNFNSWGIGSGLPAVSTGTTPKITPPSGVAPEAKPTVAPPRQYEGVIPSGVEGAKQVGAKIGEVGGKVAGNAAAGVKALLPEDTSQVSAIGNRLDSYVEDVGNWLIREKGTPAPQFKQNPLDIYLDTPRSVLDTVASPMRDIGQGAGEYILELLKRGYNPSEALPLPKGMQAENALGFYPNNVSLTYPNQRKKKAVGTKLNQF